MTLRLRVSRDKRRAAGALMLACSLASAMAAQTSTSGTTAVKKPTEKTTAHKHHKTSSKTSSTTAKPASATHTTSSGKHSRKKKPRGQQKIDADRASAIQQALIREHYLSGEPAGTWNQASEDAMRRYQADHGWQTKEVPDSRALIKLGLGPSKDHLLNPESAMTTAPDVRPTGEKSATPPSDPPKPQ